jgi:hypothetical protein
MKAISSIPIPIEPEPQLSGTQIGKLHGVSEATVRRWRGQGMPCVWYNSKLVRYKLSEVTAWLQARGSQPRPPIIPPHIRKAREAAAQPEKE